MGIRCQDLRLFRRERRLRSGSRVPGRDEFDGATRDADGLSAKPDPTTSRRRKLRAQPVDDAFSTSSGSPPAPRWCWRATARAPAGQRNYSPISLYYALAMTRLGAAGDTADEIGAVLGGSDATAAAEQCGHLQNLLMAGSSADIRLANSVWLREGAEFRQGFIDAVAGSFSASLYTARFGTPGANEAMGNWIAESTEGTIAPQVETQEGMLLSLMSALYFKSEWASPFEADATETGTFHAEEGDADASFMEQRLDKPREYRATDAYTRASLGFADGSEMTFVLPAEGVDARALLADAAALEEAFTAEHGQEHHVPRAQVLVRSFVRPDRGSAAHGHVRRSTIAPLLEPLRRGCLCRRAAESHIGLMRRR
ncbi:MAG: serpin family protein [Eggerthellaceae bacterium]